MSLESSLVAAYGREFPESGPFVAAGMSAEELRRLAELASQAPPGDLLEVGLARGTSTVALLAALDARGGPGRLTSIDPLQRSPETGGAGLEAVRRAGLGGRHEFVGEPDWDALPRLLAEGRRFALVLVDGDHRIESCGHNTLYADLLLAVGGVLVLHDSQCEGVYPVAEALARSGRYGLLSPPPLRWPVGPGARVARRLAGRHRRGWRTLAAYRKRADRALSAIG